MVQFRRVLAAHAASGSKLRLLGGAKHRWIARRAIAGRGVIGKHCWIFHARLRHSPADNRGIREKLHVLHLFYTECIHQN
jgi:hypothetical protein